MFSAKQGKYWYDFNNFFGMTRSLTGDWTPDLLFFREQYIFIDLTGLFYQKIFQYILNGYFVLNQGN